MSMPATQTRHQDASHPADANPPTFESVWALMDRVGERLDRVGERLDRVGEKQAELVASQKETDRIVKEVGRKQEETAFQLKETDRILKEQAESSNNRIGALTNLFGDVTEAMIAPKICEKFNEFGFNFLRANPNPRFNDRVNKLSFEVDIMLENGEKAMLIEAKTKLTLERIDKHIERLKEMRKYANLHGDKRIFLGAVAGIVVTDKARDYALSKGFYFIEYAGENFYITSPKDKPKEW